MKPNVWTKPNEERRPFTGSSDAQIIWPPTSLPYSAAGGTSAQVEPKDLSTNPVVQPRGVN